MILEIKKEEKELYWLGRLYCSLPLPLEFRKDFDPKTNLLYYENSLTSEILYQRPCLLYIQELLVKARLLRKYLWRQHIKYSL